MNRTSRFLWWVVFSTIVLDTFMIALPFLPRSTKSMLLGAALVKAAWCLLRLNRSKQQS
jgi:hypothetical protein